jgi:hypothetical protein
VPVLHVAKEVRLRRVIAEAQHDKPAVRYDTDRLVRTATVTGHRRVDLTDTRPQARYFAKRESHVRILRDVPDTLSEIDGGLCRGELNGLDRLEFSGQTVIGRVQQSSHGVLLKNVSLWSG